jgi:hypothetical protein
MKRIVVLLILIFTQLGTQAQSVYTASDTLIISGKIKKEIRLSFSEIKAMPDTLFAAGIKILAHDGQVKRTLPAMKVVLLKTILSKIPIDVVNRQALNNVYIECIANDGYKILYSWNELFNSPAGDSTFIVIESKDGQKSLIEDKILLITAGDILSGKRFVKNVEKIVIGHVE